MTNDVEIKPVVRDFFSRSEEEQNDFLQQTWCNQCMEMDLGMKNPQEFEAGERIWIEGDCVKCGSKVVTELVFEDDE
ncbi:hypothetical protein [Marinomonas ostreistagni]|uniref:Uncharacterized protein n=1 Tax=Marinomonas ostreistagni TaxID=359209 RepID=A0ABS0ZDM5_9GAMM|nr:hypothetical protein [Marinomonas ostreistagni]MBJ7551740.1 hypothetical protein [Marinomonas ostreistagni]